MKKYDEKSISDMVCEFRRVVLSLMKQKKFQQMVDTGDDTIVPIKKDSSTIVSFSVTKQLLAGAVAGIGIFKKCL